MGKKILVAESQGILRTGLRMIFLEDSRVSHVYVTETYSGLTGQQYFDQLDLVVINQALITDMTHLPKGKVVILTAKPDITFLLSAYRHGACAYLLENTSIELLHATVDIVEGAFLIEPVLTPLLLGHIIDRADSTINNELLTRREREILRLLRCGIARTDIARYLRLSETTLEAHIKNIARKNQAV